MLNADAIIAQGEAAVGISDPEPHLHANLRALVYALNSDRSLSGIGAESAHRNILSRTIDRLEGLKWIADHPAIAEEAIRAPVFLTGLPRSGTTYFLYLFDPDPRFRLIRTWEAVSPQPPPAANPPSVVRRKAEESEKRARMRPKNIEGFDALHLIDVDGPEECHAFMEQSYCALGTFNLYDVPSFYRYLATQADFGAAYAVHKRQLQLLQWRDKPRRWAVKYPNHTFAMDAIAGIYPDARFVMTHRDPVQTLASIAKLTRTLRSTRYDNVDFERVGRQMLGFVRDHIERILAFCDTPEGARAIHVDYYRLVDDPVTVMGEVHEGLGIDSPAALREAVADWRRDNPKNARGANLYSLEEVGLDEDEVAAEFSDYMQRFDIPREREGLARTA